MSESGARVYIIEDNQDSGVILRSLLECWGHHVVGEAYWVATALNSIGSYRELGVQIVTLDRDLYGGDVVDSGYLKFMAREFPEIPILDWQGYQYQEYHMTWESRISVNWMQ